jgi:ssDNA-binding Zn-finger/Zn-ribbon topoisomerase 1
MSEPVTPTRECPLCGGTMQLKTTETVVRVLGNPKGTTRSDTEWVCPDCDYFEEAEEER